MKHRVLFYVQHLLGVGHLKRAEILAQAMHAAELDVTMALGGKPLAEVPFHGLKIARLPSASIAGEDFSTLLDATGRPVDDDWKERRRDALLDLYRWTEADIVLIELYPFGRRQFRFELMPLLELVRQNKRRPRVACSVRDVLVAAKKPGRDEETAAVVRQYFDAVLVHGDPTLIPFRATFGAADRITDLIRYTGYVAASAAEDRPGEGAGEVLVSTGGGAVGGPLLLAAMMARRMTALADHTWRFLAGPNLPDEVFAELAAGADGRTIVERFRADFPARLKSATLSISQAGYNTTMDILRAGVPAIVVPYETRGETEQRLRSDILARKGLLGIVPAAELSPERLAKAIAEALARPRAAPAGVDLSGAATTAALLGELAGCRGD